MLTIAQAAIVAALERHHQPWSERGGLDAAELARASGISSSYALSCALKALMQRGRIVAAKSEVSSRILFYVNKDHA